MLHCTDVVQVTVCEDHCLDAVFSTTKSGHVRNEVVDTRHILLRELESEIDNIEVAIDIDDEAVATNLFKSAERVEL
jgi:hypothetical protein